MDLPGWPHYSEEEAAAVRDVIASNKVNYWTGSIGREFEREFAVWANSQYAVALANGTLALDLALRALDIGPGDEVIVTPRTFIASVSTVVNAGARPVFADVNRESGNIDAVSIRAVLTSKTKAVIPVHLGGWPCEMHEIMKLARDEQLAVIEDCAQAHGAKIGDRSVGSFGNVGAWSFCQDKIMTTGGEGGMVTTQSEELWQRMWSFKDHGKNWEAVYERKHPPGYRFVHESFGTNWRMLEVQAAIGLIQLKRMAVWTARRRTIADAISAVLADYGDIIRVPAPPKGVTHAYYRLYGYVQPENLGTGWDRDRIVAELLEAGVPVMHGTCSEVYLEKAFAGTGYAPPERLPVARELGETSITFLTHPTLKDRHVDKIADRVRMILERVAP